MKGIAVQYSIGEVSKKTEIPISTLRYYDREGMFPQIARGNGGIRSFSDQEVEALRVIECLKTSGLSIKEIKQFLDWCEEGDASLEKRRDLFYKQLDAMNTKMAELQKTIDTIKYKCWYYDTALGAEAESQPHAGAESQPHAGAEAESQPHAAAEAGAESHAGAGTEQGLQSATKGARQDSQ